MQNSYETTKMSTGMYLFVNATDLTAISTGTTYID